MPINPKRRKRSDSATHPRNGVKKSKLASGAAFRRKSADSDDEASLSSSENHDHQVGPDFSDSEDERLANYGEEGVDLSELMDADDTPVTEPDSDRPTRDHVAMLKSVQRGLGLDYGSQRDKAREAQKEVMPAKKESAFGVSAEGSSKVELGDLMAVSGFSKESKKGLEKLSRSERRLAPEGTKESKARLERGIQYEDAKAVLSEWLPTVQSMRQADSLVFPLPEQAEKRTKASTSSATASFTPQTELEKTVFGILEDSGVTEAKLQQAEDLATKRLSQEEIRARHQQLARLRSLFFYQEQKHKRQAKIKSKKYRKLLKKAKERNELTLAELEELDPEAYAAEIEKMEKARALERVGIKHGHLGKWAKHALRSKDPHTMQAVREHLEHGRQLRKKMSTDKDGSDDSDDDSDASSLHSSDLESEPEIDDDDNAGEPGDIIDIHGNVVKSKKKKIGTEDEDDEANAGIFSMKFMQRAASKKQAEHDELMHEMDHEMDERRRQLKAQRRQAKDDFNAEGLKADSDSEDDRPSSITKKRTSKMDLDDDSDAELEQKEIPLAQKAAGRRSVSASAAQVAATAAAVQSTYRHGADDSQEDEDFSTSMVLTKPQGFTSSIKGSLSVKGAQTKKSNIVSTDNMSEDHRGAQDNNGMTFKPNSKSVSLALSESPSSAQSAPKLTKAQKKANSRTQASVTTKTQIDEDAVLISTSLKQSVPSRELVGEFGSDDETIIPVPRESKAPQADNPWMMVEEDDDGLVIPGSVDPSKSASTSSKSKKANTKKKVEDRVAVDLESVQKRLKAEEAQHEVAFNLSAAGATSKSQRELIQRAFAADHLTEADVAAEKSEAVESANTVQKEYSGLVLPGWGEWAGNGLKPSARRQRLLNEMEEKKAARSAELMAARKDAKLKHVLISGKESKQTAMYHVASVPSEFKDNVALYEASLRQPMGKEWNVRESHAALVKPKLVVRPGHVIEPIQKKSESIRRK